MVYVDFKHLELPIEPDRYREGLVRKFKRYLLKKELNTLSYCKAHPPHVIKNEEGNYKLLSNHHVYLLVIDAKENGFHAIEVNEDDSVEITSINRNDIALLESALLADKTQTGAAITHQQKRTAKQVCPLCGGALLRQKSNRPKDGSEEMFEVHCQYNAKSYPHIACEFSALLEKAEFKLFRKYKYPTSNWMKKLKSLCPKCNVKHLYERNTLSGKVFHQCVNTLIGRYMVCDYKTEIK